MPVLSRIVQAATRKTVGWTKDSAAALVNTALSALHSLNEDNPGTKTVIPKQEELPNRQRPVEDRIFSELDNLPLTEAVSILESLPGYNTQVETYAGLLRRCGVSKSISEGTRIHSHLVRSNNMHQVRYMANCLMDMYSKCGEVEQASDVFKQMPERNVYSWTIMMTAYAQNGHPKQALHLFREMQQQGVIPNNHTLSVAISACSSLLDVASGKSIHESMNNTQGIMYDSHVGNSLMDFYTRAGRLRDVMEIFNEMLLTNSRLSAVSWTCAIVACVQLGSPRDAFELFRKMELEGVRPDPMTYATMLDACASTSSLSLGSKFHSRIVDLGLDKTDTVLQTALMTMYARCGGLSIALQVFNQIDRANVVAWSSMILAYAQNGESHEALKLFWRMEQDGDPKPSETTLVSVLYACSHAGLFEQAYDYFTTMTTERKLEMQPGHYGCVVDLLGRAGRLAEAEQLISKLENTSGSSCGVIWTILLSACKMHKDMARAERAANRIFKLSPDTATPYVLLSNVYCEAGRWDLAAKLRKKMDLKNIKKPAGKSWVEVNGKIHEFIVGDLSHPDMDEIMREFKRLLGVIKEAGYVPDTRAVLHNAEEDEKEGILHYHSEKLATVLGLLRSPNGEPLRIVKNLRVCWDCHGFVKYVSKVVNRKIVVRDTKQFHHFVNGTCSCGDYW